MVRDVFQCARRTGAKLPSLSGAIIITAGCCCTADWTDRAATPCGALGPPSFYLAIFAAFKLCLDFICLEEQQTSSLPDEDLASRAEIGVESICDKEARQEGRWVISSGEPTETAIAGLEGRSQSDRSTMFEQRLGWQ